MTDRDRGGPPAPGPRPGARRRAVSLDPAGLVDSGPFADGQPAPWVYRPRLPVDLAEWIRVSRDQVERQILAHGPVLLLGFGLTSADQFEQVARAFTDDLLNYVEGSSPRTM